MNSKSDKNVIKKIQIASENAVKVTSKKVTDDLVVIEINDKLMTEEHIQMFSSAVDEQLADKCKSFVVDPRVKGNVTVVSSASMSAEAVYELFLSVLRVHGYAAVIT